MPQDGPFFFVRTLWGAMRHADWEAAAQRGILAIIVEFFRTLMGLSAWPFFIPIDSEWRPSSIRQILTAHGIESWGWGRQGGEYFFQVKLRQATWAQYLLQQHAVPLSGQLLDEGKRSAYRPAPRRSLRAAGGTTPALRARASVEGNQAALHANEASPPASFLRDPVGQIDRAVDRLAKW